jgi:hypothetical protein
MERLQESILSGASKTVHQSHTQSLFIDGLAEDDFDIPLITLAKKIE